jgi:hypothetical protein
MKTKSKIWKIITGDTKTRQVSGVSVRITGSKDLSAKLYKSIDRSDNFKISSKDGKTYTIKQLVPTKR